MSSRRSRWFERPTSEVEDRSEARDTDERTDIQVMTGTDVFEDEGAE